MQPNFNQGINPAGYGVGIQSNYQSPLLGMLSQLLQKHLAPNTIGNNKIQVGQNETRIGYIDPSGAYHDGVGNGGY